MKWILAFGVLLIVLAGCSDRGTPADPIVATGPVKEFEMKAMQFFFVPAVVTVNKGDFVRLTIVSNDVTHGMSIPAFGVNARLSPGKTETVEFVADKVGMFPFRCSVFCGSGHSGMLGAVEVLE